MIKNEYNVIGVMSGTSLDGLDLAFINFRKNKEWTFKIISAETLSYNEKWKFKLMNLLNLTDSEFQKIDQNYSIYLSNSIKSFIDRYNIKKLDAICSHGHTALHQPEKGITYQIGNLEILAELLNKKVICDFRTQDVKLGGQGAPLVPIGDELLFPQYDYCINLGGFANLSTNTKSTRIAYDICPVNVVLNHYVKNLNLEYDDKGMIAKTGKINQMLLNELNNLDYYSRKHPKSLGMEWVNATVFPIIDAYNLKSEEILRTFIEHIAIQISNEIISDNFRKNGLITGGGAYNSFLIDRIREYSNCNIIIPENKIVDFKEALVFGFLGVLRLRNEVNCLRSVTGAKHDHCSGKIFLPHNNSRSKQL